MSTKELKDVLVQKLQDENCGFPRSDLSIRKKGKNIEVVVKGYEHCTFTIEPEEDDYFGYCLYTYCDTEIIDMLDSKKDYPWRQAMVHIGYYIGTRF